MDTNTKKLNVETGVSILMLTYNRAHFIVEAVQSVLSQSYQQWELIIIDDGSTDTTSDIIQSFGDSRIKYVKHPENAGLHARRRESLELALGNTTTKYVAILDSDDIWPDVEKLGKQVTFLNENSSCVLVGTNTILIDKDGAEISQDIFYTNDSQIRKNILIRNQFTHSAVLMRTDALLKTRGYQPTLAEDLELFLQLGQHGTFANLTEFMTKHRIHSDSENDRGIKMATAVHNIIKTHGSKYPHYFLALVKSYLRLLKARLN